MFVKQYHLAVAAFLVCIISCNADDPRLVVSDLEYSSISTQASTLHLNLTGPPTVKPIFISSTVPSKVDTSTNSKSQEKPSAVIPNPDASSSTVKASVDPVTVPVSPTTVLPDPDKSTDAPKTSSTSVPSTTAAPATTTAASPKTTPVTTSPPTPSTSSAASTPSTSVKPPITTAPTAGPTASTAAPAPPAPTPTVTPHHNRQFDGPSFFGGIVLATGLMAIGFVAFKFYKARTERNYHTL